ncbi:hypothetical protein HPP92_022452 [Vanilla planifolia]|uniref:RING-type domain-containing protein n=1 Tax=Vanilla planifolia TaxID=51239 RepID=A0A835UDU0_VANPL|nr:hypothetical protein HPP92_022755 [Vanilla planifolia]KAG0459324.1 hypothetical protein HPP92_022452 [Vanilla planifolia]
MASAMPIYYSHIAHKQIYYTPEEQAEQSGDPLLLLDLSYLLYGEKIECTVPFHQTLDDQSSNLSFLKTIITTLEPMPMDFLMEPQLAEMVRDFIVHKVSYLAQSNVGVAELKILHVKVIVEVCDEETNVELLSEKRMTLVRIEKAFEQEEGCAICLEDVSAEELVARTPCLHRFHATCLRRWFEKAGSCPLCRFVIDP